MIIESYKNERYDMDIMQESVCSVINPIAGTVLPAKGDSDVMFCLHSYQGLITDRSLVY